MIVIINGSERDRYRGLINDMHRQRARVFKDRLGWDVEVRDGMEVDWLDDENPLYLISVDDETGRLRGSLRLLPTTGPNMLRDIFRNCSQTTLWLKAPRSGKAHGFRWILRQPFRFLVAPFPM